MRHPMRAEGGGPRAVSGGKTLIAALAIVTAACGAQGGQAAAPPPDTRAAAQAPPVTEVTVVRPTTEPLRTDVDAPGTFVPYEEATIGAEAAGPVVEVRVEEGSRVGRGQVLVRLDPVKAQLAVKQAQAQLEQTRANFAKAHSEIARKQQLLEDRTIAPGTFETYKAQHDAAAAGVEAAETALELAQQRLRDLTLTAPFAGVIREKKVAVGEYVREGDDLLVLMRVDPIKLQFDMPEQYAARVAQGHEIQGVLAALPGQTVAGRITKIFPAVAVQSRTVRLEALVPNAAYRLRPGFYATVRVPITSMPGSFVVPRSAIVRREGTESVFVVRGDRVELVRVRAGASTADKIEILSGLASDEAVVIAGGEALRAGDRVKVRSGH